MNCTLEKAGEKAIALLLAAVLALGLAPLPAFAAPTYTIDVSTGSTEISRSATVPGTLAISVGGVVLHDGVDPDSTIVLTGSTSSNQVIVDIGDPTIPVHIEFDSLSIKGIASGPFAIKESSIVDITLTGVSELQGNDRNSRLTDAMLAIGDDSILTFTEASTGSLLVNLVGAGAGIGTASFTGSTGSLIVNGGTIEGKVLYAPYAGGSESAMIGAGMGGSFKSITVNGGVVRATSAKRAAIGAGTTTINGGTVIAENNPTVQYYSEPVIGVTGGTTTITGGTVTSTGSGYNLGGKKIILTGGSVHAAQGTYQTNPTNGYTRVYPTVLALGGAHEAVSVGELDGLRRGLHTDTVAKPAENIYRISGIVSDASANVYPWLPALNVPVIDVADHASVTGYDDSGLPRTIAAGLSAPAELTVLNKDDFTETASFAWLHNGSPAGAASSLVASERGRYTLEVSDASLVDGGQTVASSLRAIDLQAQYRVVFDKNGGFGYDHAQDKIVGAPLALDPNGYTRTGYSFVGWNTQQDGQGEAYADNAILSVDHTLTAGSTVTLYAQWAPHTYFAQFVGNGADAGTMPDQRLAYGDTTQLLDGNLFSRTGYAFAGWNTSYDGGGVFYADKAAVSPDLTSTENVKVPLFAQWAANSYDVVYDGNGSDAGYPMAIQGFTYDDEAQSLDMNSFARIGYTFTGWNTDPAGAGSSFADGAAKPNVSAIDGDTVTLFAQWTANTYDIAFNGNGSDSGAMDPIETVWDAAVAVSAPDSAFSLLGYTFTGWNTQADGAGTPYAVNSDLRNISPGDSGATVVLYAQWAPTQYNVVFDGNGSDSGSMTDQLMTYDAIEALEPVGFGRTGYLFSTWLYTAADGSQHMFADGELVSNLSSDGTHATLVAQWAPVNYTVRFHGNNATSGSMFDLPLSYDQASTLSANTFARGGHTFDGWNTAADGSGVAFADEEAVAGLSATDGDVVNLYAQWKEHSPTLTLDVDGGYERGATVTVDGTGFEPHALVTLTMHSTPVVVGSLAADAQGSLAGTFTVPVDAAFGDHVLEGDDGFHIASVQFKVLGGGSAGGGQSGSGGATSELVKTGDTVLPLVLGGIGVVALASVCVALVCALRRRQRG